MRRNVAKGYVWKCKAEPENPIITTATVGSKNPMYCTSLGKAILAYTEEETRQQVISRIRFQKKTERTILTAGRLETELDRQEKEARIAALRARVPEKDDEGGIDEIFSCHRAFPLTFPCVWGTGSVYARNAVISSQSHPGCRARLMP